MNDPLGPDDATGLAAAELALGLLDGDERAVALRRVIADREFAADVARWRDHFAPLHDRQREADVPDHLFGRIEHSLDHAGAPTPAPARRAWLWPAFASAAAAAVAAVVVIRLSPDAPVPPPVVVAAPAPTPTPTTILVAVLEPVERGAQIAAVYDASRRALRLMPASYGRTGRSQQLWVIGGDGVPHSLGLVGERATALTITPADRARIAAGATLAISIEPAGGSPTALPTGPVVAKGALSDV